MVSPSATVTNAFLKPGFTPEINPDLVTIAAQASPIQKVLQEPWQDWIKALSEEEKQLDRDEVVPLLKDIRRMSMSIFCEALEHVYRNIG